MVLESEDAQMVKQQEQINEEWLPIKSSPDVFTELVRDLGCFGVRVEELFNFDEKEYEEIKPVHGLIFRFQHGISDIPDGRLLRDYRRDDVVFIRQVIRNATLTQALLSVLLNCSHPDVDLGQMLTEFKTFFRSFNESAKGLALVNATNIRVIHNSLAKSAAQVAKSQKEKEQKKTKKAAGSDSGSDSEESLPPPPPKSEEDVIYHYVSYVCINGRMYELDGLQPGPIDLGIINTNSEWFYHIKPIIQDRMKRYHLQDVSFSLYGVVTDRIRKYERKMDEIRKSNTSLEMQQQELTRLQELIAEEQLKIERYKLENVARKHDYMPFLSEMMRLLSQDEKLMQEAVRKAYESCQASPSRMALIDDGSTGSDDDDDDGDDDEDDDDEDEDDDDEGSSVNH